MNPFIQPPQDGTEIVEARRLHGKVFNMGGLRRKSLSKVSTIIHCPAEFAQKWSGQNLQDVDLTPFTGRTWYTLARNGVGVTYQSKRRGLVSAVYTHAGGNPLRNVAPEIVDNRIYWRDVATDLDICCEVRPAGVKFLKILKSANAPQDILYRVTGIQSQIQDFLRGDNVQLNTKSKGWDNDNKNPNRDGRRIEVIDTVQDLGGGTFEINNQFTGRTLGDFDSVTRQRKWLSGESIYPVVVNADITEDITVNNDDGSANTGASSWLANNVTWINDGGGNAIPGFRFVTVGVGQGDTIDSGTRLILTIKTNPTGGNVSGDLYGEDADDAAAWSNSKRPDTITKTTAKTNILITDNQTGTNTVNCVAMIQEIVDRTGWASGNDLALACGVAVGYSRSVIWSDYNDSTVNDATLEINFTASSSRIAGAHGRLGFNF